MLTPREILGVKAGITDMKNKYDVKEIWKINPKLPMYAVSSLGQVRNINTGKLLKPYLTYGGYLTLSLSSPSKKSHRGRLNYRVHRLVLDTFVGEHPDKEVDHINGRKDDNRLVNLEFVSGDVNISRSLELGLDCRVHENTKFIPIGNQQSVIRTTKNRQKVFYYDTLGELIKDLTENGIVETGTSSQIAGIKKDIRRAIRKAIREKKRVACHGVYLEVPAEASTHLH